MSVWSKEKIDEHNAEARLARVRADEQEARARAAQAETAAAEARLPLAVEEHQHAQTMLRLRARAGLLALIITARFTFEVIEVDEAGHEAHR